MKIQVRLILFILISLIFFVRGKVFNLGYGGSISRYIPYLVLWLIFLILLKLFNKKNTNNWSKSFLVFVLTLFFFQILNIIFYPNISPLIFEFLLEMFLNISIYYCIYSLLSLRIISFDQIFKYIKISSLFAIIPVFVVTIKLDSIRRIGAGGDADESLPIAVNHLGHALSLASMLFLDALFRKGKIKFSLIYFTNLGITILLISSTILVGSKAAVGSIIVYVLIMLFINIKAIKKNIAYIIIGVLIVSFIPNLINNNKYTNLIERFSDEGIQRGFKQRFNSYKMAYRSTKNNAALLSGEPWRYQLINPNNAIPYPHNYFLSILLHLGFATFFVFILYNFLLLFFLIKKILLSKNSDIYVLLLGMLLAVIFYISTSGRITRVMTLFIIYPIIDFIRKNNESSFN